MFLLCDLWAHNQNADVWSARQKAEKGISNNTWSIQSDLPYGHSFSNICHDQRRGIHSITFFDRFECWMLKAWNLPKFVIAAPKVVMESEELPTMASRTRERDAFPPHTALPSVLDTWYALIIEFHAFLTLDNTIHWCVVSSHDCKNSDLATSTSYAIDSGLNWHVHQQATWIVAHVAHAWLKL